MGQGILKSIGEKNNLKKEVDHLRTEMEQSQNELDAMIQGSKTAEEQAKALESSLRQELKDLAEEDKALRDRMGLGKRDLELMQEEAQRLKTHIKAFQRDINEGLHV